MTDQIAPKLPRDDSDPFRYGIYLRPDARTCRAVTVVTDQLRAQYGLLSAGAFPPHATLVGSQPFGFAEPDVIDAVTTLLRSQRSFDVHNAGIRPQGRGYVYDVSENPDGGVNEEFVRLARDIDATVAPFRRPMNSPLPNDFEPDVFHAHLSLASHDLYVRPDLYAEVGEFIRELDVPVPAGFVGRTVVMYRTACADWSGRWWQTMTWEHIRTWRLTSG
ncbi:2'-5' RNA ligase family protein [Microbacterium sp. cx-55]|uniref:2'-5' RNA ligase family protein n=1 Tax=unclassified Microbacterium TaxID=2609290 RepID=UPI001CBCC4CB|nr:MULTISPECIES: 2'-5' RNA ligase family protein [unclassified Microbacterium]MBZ4487541.1 2'-5' RNA ligase family protein [Microbacterium sp. cx-55]MCC4908310.1 2'-5' RNA ligase family protein [Microbacterium sp. cx-59]UGB35561.1 2'-5' RNA ligase family protein [Microbacterium sp. cx-55]